MCGNRSWFPVGGNEMTSGSPNHVGGPIIFSSQWEGAGFKSAQERIAVTSGGSMHGLGEWALD